MSNEFWKVHFILNWHIDAILTFDDLDNSRNCQEMFLQIGRSGILPLSRRLVVVRKRWNHIFTITGHFADRCDIYILEVEISTVKSRVRDCFIVVNHCCRKYFSWWAFLISLMTSTITIILCNMYTKRRRRYHTFIPKWKNESRNLTNKSSDAVKYECIHIPRCKKIFLYSKVSMYSRFATVSWWRKNPQFDFYAICKEIEIFDQICYRTTECWWFKLHYVITEIAQDFLNMKFENTFSCLYLWEQIIPISKT